MSKEYLIPNFVLKDIDKCLDAPKKSVSFKKYKAYASSETKHWIESNSFPIKILFYIFKNNLSKIIIPNCPVCGKELTLNQVLVGSSTCSVKCSASLDTRTEKIKKTKLERYGSASYHNVEKMKETNLKRYGVETSFTNKKSREKAKQTYLKHFGVDNPSKCKEIQEKKGLKWNSKESKEKGIRTKRKNHYDIFIEKLKQKKIELVSSKEEYCNPDNEILKFKCLKCGNVWESSITNPQNIYCNKCVYTKSGKKQTF